MGVRQKTHTHLLALCGIVAACSKPPHQTQVVNSQNAANSAADQKAFETTLASVNECVSNVDKNLQYWQDANGTVRGLEAECPVVIMKMRHVASLLRKCRELVEQARARGGLKGDIIAKAEEIETRLKEAEGKVLPDSDLMVSCKKWANPIMARPLEGPPSTSIPDGRCPTYGQILRDARNRYNATCAYAGSCRDKLKVTDRTPDPYDKTRCDTAVKVGREPVFISGLYRRLGENWQLEAIN